MCRGILSGAEGARRTPLQLHEELKHIHGWCTTQKAAPAGLAIVATFETELAQSRAATIARVETATSYTSSIQAGTHVSQPIPILSSSANQEAADDKMINHFSAFDQQTDDHNKYRINTRRRDFKGEAPGSIFSTAFSPPGYTGYYNTGSHSSTDLGTPPHDFLGACVSCKRPLGPGKDIYMYRGDRAFCSMECRYQHMVADERLGHASQQHAQTPSSIKKSRFTPAAAIIVN